ncbi:hypothetical protein [Primorskyibacter sp. S187A]|uniref:hypothetical protein n=1 Tax=Primorskyibacter sp. S187A TaxID=3415130 RepID=UPI003C7C6A52
MSDKTPPAGTTDKALFAITGGFIALFCAYAFLDLDGLSALVDSSFAFSAKYFGLYWQVLLLATFLIGLVLCVLPGSRTLMGGACYAGIHHLQLGRHDHVHPARWRRRVLGGR